MMRRKSFDLHALALGLIAIGGISSPAMAYIGPGAGISAIGTFLAVVGAVLLLIIGFLWYPVKRMLRRSKAKQNLETDPTGNTAATARVADTETASNNR